MTRADPDEGPAPALLEAAEAGQPEALFDLARREFRAGRYAEAIRRWQQLLAIRPDDAVALTGFGATLQKTGQLGDARLCYERAIELEPANADAHCNLGSLLQGSGALEQALASYREALRVQPGQPVAAAGIAAVLDWQGRYQEAMDFVSPWVMQSSPDPELLLIYARLLRRMRRQQEAIELLSGALARDPQPAYSQRMHFVLGDLHDDLSHFDAAFAHYTTGNRLRKARYDPQAHAAMIDTLIRFFSKQRFASLASSGMASERPVFIVGMPRSGTSLVEQILAAHSKVHAAGELPVIGNMARGLGQFLRSGKAYPACLEGAQQASLEALANEYVRLAAADSTALKVTDKMPLNFMHLGLIQMLFPMARIIHCRRNAMDTALSCYFQNFGGTGMPFAYDFEHIASFYRDYRRIIKHYRGLISMPVLDVDYEQLVADQESISRAIIDFVGLEWESACLEFHRLQRAVTTASHAQVRQPIYTRSVDRYRNYVDHLGTLVSALGDDVRR